MRKILLAIFLASCSRSENTMFREPGPISRSIVHACTHVEASPILEHLSGKRRLKDVGRDFLKDIGGVSVHIPTEYGTLEGMYFHPGLFHEKETAVYKKWKKVFAAPKNVRLSLIYEINFKGQSLPALFSLPRMMRPSKKTKEHTLGVLCLPAKGLDYELDPQFILTFLLRGVHVLAINYEGMEWKRTCYEAKSAVEWFAKYLEIPYDNLTICGKSFGSGPATFAAAECPGTNLIIDRGYARFSDLYPNTPIRWLLEKYYRFPNEDWISKVQGKVLIIEAKDESLFQGHAQRLYNAAPFPKTLISGAGSHYGLYWGDPSPSWYTDPTTQSKLDPFFN